MAEDNVKAQMRKGILEYCILAILSREDSYAPKIIAELKQAEMIVVEGTLYPILTRQKNAGLLTYRWEESPQGPPRKYYTLDVYKRQGKEPVAFDHDCREGICGMCSLHIDGHAHGPGQAATTCQIYMRKFKDGATITIEPVSYTHLHQTGRVGRVAGAADFTDDQSAALQNRSCGRNGRHYGAIPSQAVKGTAFCSGEPEHRRLV